MIKLLIFLKLRVVYICMRVNKQFRKDAFHQKNGKKGAERVPRNGFASTR